MKKFVFPFLVFTMMCATFLSNAQVNVSLGLKGGPNFATASLDPESEFLDPGDSKSSVTRFVVGGAVQIGFPGPVSIQAEPMYTQKGFKIEGQGFEAKVKVDYITIPVLVKAKFGTSSVKPYLFAGPNIGIQLSSEVVAEGGGQSQTTDIDSITSSTDFAIDFGGGAEFEVAPMVSITADARYSLGLSNIVDVTTQPGATEPSAKSRGFQILVGVLFRVGR